MWYSICTSEKGFFFYARFKREADAGKPAHTINGGAEK